MGEALNHPLLRYRALLRGRGLFAAKVDLVQRGVEHVRRDVEFVGCVGAEPEDVGGQVGRELSQILSGYLPPLGYQLPDDLHHVDRGVEHDQVAQQRVLFDRLSCSAGSFSAITPWLPNRGPGGEPVVGLGLAAAAVTRARSPESARNRSSATVRITRPTSRNAL